MYTLFFTVCLHAVCTIKPIDHPMPLAECVKTMQSISAGAGALNCMKVSDDVLQPVKK